ncbi:MAG TPA: hypothetical protein VHE14_06930, partial [Solirubrobacteraceae bacterium]|nr:hypothetical protein [Solirubrobacteraceae bacterium]
FTISQVGLVRHWRRDRRPRWRARAVLNATGAVMTGVAVVVFVSTKFLAGAWVVVIAVPLLMVLFARVETYYAQVASELRLGQTPPPPRARESIVLVPVSTVNLLTTRALSAALSLGDRVIALDVACDEEEQQQIQLQWRAWNPGIELEVLISPQRALVRSVLHYLESLDRGDSEVTVLIAEIEPRKRRHEILHNQRGALLAAALGARADVVVARLPFRLHD